MKESGYKYVKVLPPLTVGDYYEVQLLNDDDELVDFNRANTVDETLEEVKKFLEIIKDE